MIYILLEREELDEVAVNLINTSSVNKHRIEVVGCYIEDKFIATRNPLVYFNNCYLTGSKLTVPRHTQVNGSSLYYSTIRTNKTINGYYTPVISNIA